MKISSKTVAALGLALAAATGTFGATSALAQAEGKIATVDARGVIIATQAFQTGYEQIRTTYSAQIQTRQERAQRRQQLLESLDTNGDREINDAELAAAEGTPQATELAQIDSDLQGIQQQLDGARVFVIDQILGQYAAALTEVTEQQQIGVVLAPEVVLFPANGVDISQAVVTSLNAKIPSAGIVPPQTWQPRPESVALFQQIQQFLLRAQAIQQQQAAAAAQQGEAPATQPPSGR
ncbi:MAG: OmpH family outer membrane protein [Pseudomonadota bacterium]